MARIYDRPVSQLMRELIAERLTTPHSVLTRREAIAWFAERYPKIRPGTVAAHIVRFATNEPTRLHYNYRPVDDDVLFKIEPGRFRLYNAATDPAPITEQSRRSREMVSPVPAEPEEEDSGSGSEAFAYERDLRNYLSKKLHRLEPGLRLFEEDDINGIEFPVGGRFIDILALSAADELVVIELKVSRGYDRVIGQLLRYMAWIEENQAEPDQRVRGVIIAREISQDLLLACSRLTGVTLFEYDLQVQLRQVTFSAR